MQIKKFGMNDNLGPIYITDAEEKGIYTHPYSENMHKIVDKEAQNLISSAYFKTEELLKKNIDKLEKVTK